MSHILSDVDAIVLAGVLAAGMMAGWWLGWSKGWRMMKEARGQPASKFSEATLAILGLLLAFTFSMSMAKHEQRRLMVVNDSNAIGDFYTCASLVKEPIRGQLQRTIRAYVEHRLALANEHPSESAIQQKLAEMQEMQNQMQSLVGEAVSAGTPIAAPLVNTFNSLTSNHAARVAAVRDRLPWNVVCLLFIASIVPLVLVGMQQGAAGEWRPAATAAFVVLVSMVVWITLDFNQPQRGVITVSQEPLQRLLSGMGR